MSAVTPPDLASAPSSPPDHRHTRRQWIYGVSVPVALDYRVLCLPTSADRIYHLPVFHRLYSHLGIQTGEL